MLNRLMDRVDSGIIFAQDQIIYWTGVKWVIDHSGALVKSFGGEDAALNQIRWETSLRDRFPTG